MSSISLIYDTYDQGDIRYKAMVSTESTLYLSGTLVGRTVRPIIGAFQMASAQVYPPFCPSLPLTGATPILHLLNDMPHVNPDTVVAGGRGRFFNNNPDVPDNVVHPLIYLYQDYQITHSLYANTLTNYEITALSHHHDHIYAIANPIPPYTGDSQFVIFDPHTRTFLTRAPCRKPSLLRYFRAQEKLQIDLTDIHTAPNPLSYLERQKAPIVTTGYMRTHKGQMAGMLTTWSKTCDEVHSYFHIDPDPYTETRYTKLCIVKDQILVLGHRLYTGPVVKGHVRRRKTHFLHLFDYVDAKPHFMEEHTMEEHEGFNRYLNKFIVYDDIVYIPCYYHQYRDTNCLYPTIKERYAIQKWSDGCLMRHFFLDPDINHSTMIQDFAILDNHICYLTHVNNHPMILSTGVRLPPVTA